MDGEQVGVSEPASTMQLCSAMCGLSSAWGCSCCVPSIPMTTSNLFIPASTPCVR